MKETPPVLTAGPAAWVRNRGRKRSGLLGNAAQVGRGWAGAAGPARGESTRVAPLVRSVSRPRAWKKASCLPGQPLLPQKPAAAEGPAAALGEPTPSAWRGLAEGGTGTGPLAAPDVGCSTALVVTHSGLHPEPHVVCSVPLKLPNGNICVIPARSE